MWLDINQGSVRIPGWPPVRSLAVFTDWLFKDVLHRNVQRFRGGLVFKAHRLFVSLNSRLESNKEEEEEIQCSSLCGGARGHRTPTGTDLISKHS